MIKNEQVAIWVRKTRQLLEDTLTARENIGRDREEGPWDQLYAIRFIYRVDQMPVGVPANERKELISWRDQFLEQIDEPYPPARLEAMAREQGFTEYLKEHGPETYRRPQRDEFYSPWRKSRTSIKE